MEVNFGQQNQVLTLMPQQFPLFLENLLILKGT